MAIQIIHPASANDPQLAVPFVITTAQTREMLNVLRKFRNGERSYFCEYYSAGDSIEISFEFNRQILTIELHFTKPENSCIIVRFMSTISESDLDRMCSVIENALTMKST